MILAFLWRLLHRLSKVGPSLASSVMSTQTIAKVGQGRYSRGRVRERASKQQEHAGIRRNRQLLIKQGGALLIKQGGAMGTAMNGREGQERAHHPANANTHTRAKRQTRLHKPKP
jgi:hypothetical protein